MNDVTLTVDGVAYGGWVEIVINRALDSIAGSFEVALTERFAGLQAQDAIATGSRCCLAIDGETVITGWVDEAGVAYDGRSHRLSLRGRDVTGDLVDCAAMPAFWPSATLLAIAGDICQPFGIKVAAEGVELGATFIKQAVRPGERAFEVIDRLAAMVGVVPLSDGLGGLLFTRAGAARPNTVIRLGENALRLSGRRSDRERFQSYLVIGQGAANNGTAPAAAYGPKGMAEDPGITRYRPFIVAAEIAGSDPALYTQRAQWEASVRYGRAWRFSYRVQGWRDSAGQLWRPNAM
ncbi:MAG TPA: hypothetical protein VKT70_12445, partial [Stellaceae bacterium]|nr:hypothetical protein [Stellaceae bacterium]